MNEHGGESSWSSAIPECPPRGQCESPRAGVELATFLAGVLAVGYNLAILPAEVTTAVVGGLLIGAAASGLLLFTGRLAGISGIVAGLLPPRQSNAAWRAAFVAGLLAGGVLLRSVAPEAFSGPHPQSWPLLVGAGLLVGFGTRIGNGCTSGHGVCGLSRRSLRSLVATLTFMATGAATVYLVGHVLGRPWW